MSLFFFSSRRRHTRSYGDWSSDVCSSDLPAPGAVVRTEGPRGGTYVAADGRRGRWEPAPVPGSPPGVLPDAYGCGDSFTGGLTFGLGAGMPLDQALALAARCGAACRAGKGAYG